jgi:hypothetical protein
VDEMDEVWTICGDGQVVDDFWTMDELWTKWMKCGRFVDDG